MSPVRLIILLVAAGAAIAAVFLVQSIQSPQNAEASAVAVAAEMPTKQVLVARRDIPVGRFVTVEDLRWQAWPEEGETPSFVDKEVSPEALEEYVGAVAIAGMSTGEPVIDGKLVHPGDQGFMAAMLEPGMRAVAIETTIQNSGGGFVLPQDRVDVMVVRTIEGKPAMVGEVTAETLLANVRVLAIDGIYSQPVEEQAAVLIGSRFTLELSDPDANLLYAANESGNIKVTLRSIADLQQGSGATPLGRSYRDGNQNERVRVYRNGNEQISTVPAG